MPGILVVSTAEAISRQNDLSNGYETPDLIRGHEIINLGTYMEVCLYIPLTWPVLKSDYKLHEFKYANCLITAKKKMIINQDIH